MNNFDSIDDTKAFSEQQSFIVTKEYRRFAEFCDACLREQYIGLCYGSPGVGKTLSARYYTKWFFLETRLQPHLPYAPLLPELKDCDKLFYTAPVSSPPRLIRENIRSLRVELGRFNSEFSVPGQQDVPAYAVADHCKLIIVDETERLSLTAIDQLREIYDRGGLGLIFIGMPGLEKKLSRYPQLYSRIGFAHNYRALSREEMRFLLSHYWEQFGLSLDPNDYTKEYSLDLQLNALREYGCEKIFTDTVSGAKAIRPGLDEMLSSAQSKDVIVIWKLDRLGRSLKHLVELVAELNKRNIGLRSLQDKIDTTSHEKKLVLNIFASLAEFEREIIRERTNVGLASARARGRLGGRKPGLNEEALKKARIAESYYSEGMPVNEIAKSLSISKATLYKYLRFRGVEISPYRKHSSG